MNTKEENRLKLIENFERELPDFAHMVKSHRTRIVIFHQAAFAADYEEHEFRLLGMAIKYAGLYGKELGIVLGEED